MPGFSFSVGSTYEVDRQREIACDKCSHTFEPFRNISLKKLALLSILIFPGTRYVDSHFECPQCGADLLHHKQAFKT